MKFHTTEQVSMNMHKTPDGYLLCRDVAIARTGEMMYGSGEIEGVEAGKDGYIRVTRTPEEVFSETTIASFQGKSVTLNHPEEFVNPSNWGILTKGTVQNVRRGEGVQDDLLLADLLITDEAAINEIRSGLREVSCGYNASYAQDSPGIATQKDIIGNHVALVTRGRCGPVCKINDSEPVMTKKPTIQERILAIFKDAEAEAASETEAEKKEREAKEAKDAEMEAAAEKEKQTADSIAKLSATVDALTKAVALLVKDAEGETEEEKKAREEKEAKDALLAAEEAAPMDLESVQLYTGDAARASVLARAEILAPGIKLPTNDAAVSTKDAALALCNCQRRALGLAYKTEDGKKAIDLISATSDFDKMAPATVNAVFNGAAEIVRVKNNDATRKPAPTTTDYQRSPAGMIEAMNKRNAEFFGRA